MSDTDIFVEETLPNEGGYQTVFGPLEIGGENIHKALDFMSAHKERKLELWSKAHAAGPKGFAPMAYTENGNVLWSNTLSMLFGLSSLDTVK